MELKTKIKEDKSQEHSFSKTRSSSDISNTTSRSSGFFMRSSSDIKEETFEKYYERRKNIIFGKIDVNRNQNYISRFLLDSQKSINAEFSKVTSFFFDIPQTVYKITLNLKENIANFGLIIRLYLINQNKEKAFEIFLLMCKQNEKIIELIYNKLKFYCEKASPAMVRLTPNISKNYIQILSCLIKLSGIFSKTTLQNFFCISYIKTIYSLTLGGIPKINAMALKNDIISHRLYLYSSCLFDCSLFNFYRYQSLCFSTRMLKHIMELYQEKESKDYTNYEQILMLKANYNSGLFFYVDGINDEAINNLLQAKNILFEMGSSNNKNEKDNELYRNSLILETKETNLLSGLTFFKGKINNIDDKKIKLINRCSKKGLICEDSSKELPKKQSSVRNPTSLFLGIQKIALKQPLLFEQIKRKINNEIELLLTQIELKKKNYRGALEHINIILNKQKVKVDGSEPISSKQTFHMINKTFKNLKSFQGIRVRKLNFFKNDENKNNKDNYCNYEELMLSENELKMIKMLLEKIEQEYTEQSQIEHCSSFIQRNNYFNFSSKTINRIKYKNFKEMEKFFIFICSLSLYQLKILNESQPKSSSKRNDLPIIFSNKFQDCLTNAQRISLSQLETMSLTRYILLIDTDKDISPENLDYKYMKYRVKSSVHENSKDDNELKNIVEDKRKTINSRKTIDSGINTISANNNINNNITITKKRNIKKEFEYEDKNNVFDILLMQIKNEKNQKFIESHKKSILQILNNLSSNDKKLFQQSPILLEKLLNKIEKKMKNNNNSRNSNFTISRYSSRTESFNLNFTFKSSNINDCKK